MIKTLFKNIYTIGGYNKTYISLKSNYNGKLLSVASGRKIRTSAKHLVALQSRPPVVTIMGHVDHGKTTLLDHLRNSQIVKQEFGGITQHIGAFVVPFKQKTRTELVTFLDTPGHAAFAAMRQRGANVTDIVVLVVACDDGVLDQTVESIRYAKESQVPIIVAINKCDKFPDAASVDKNIELVRKQLIVYDVISEQDGGDVQLVKISALYGTGVEELKEAILALAETLELRADVECKFSGMIIESSVDAHRGKLCTVLVQQGVLRKGNIVMSGFNWAKVRALYDERNKAQDQCEPGLPIQLVGWREEELPSAGDSIVQVGSETEAKQIIHELRQERTLEKATEDSKLASERYKIFYEKYKANLIKNRESGMKYRRMLSDVRGVRSKETVSDPSQDDKRLNLILKCDVDGSLDALLDLLDTYDADNSQIIKLDIMHHGVGAITENDYNLASSFPNTVIYGFNVKPANQKILVRAKKDGVCIKFFNVIYHLVDDLKVRISEKMPELEREVIVGQAQVMQEFVVKETNKKRTHVAGCRCSKGSLKKDYYYRLLRNQEVVADKMQIKTLKYLKEEVKEIDKDQDCGVSFKDQEGLQFFPGDHLVAYELQKYKPRLKWSPKGFV